MGRGLVELSESWSRGEEQDVGEEGSRKGLELNVSRKQIRLKATNFTNPTDDRPLETRNSSLERCEGLAELTMGCSSFLRILRQNHSARGLLVLKS